MTGTILRKDLATLWASPLPYLTGAAFHAVLAVLVVDQLQGRGQAVVQPLFPIAGFLLLLVVPLLTMRAFAEEARSGTLDLLLVAPVPGSALAAGKWLAAWLSTLVVVAPAATYVVLIALWGEPDLGPAVAGFVGLALLAAAVAGIGVLASALTTSQPVAAMVTVFGVLVLWFADRGDAALSAGSTLARVSLSERFRLFAGGAIGAADAAWFLAVGVGAVVLAAAAVGMRRSPGSGR
ncbi:MAG TPA: ABC transporter permease subunit [Acidimicrobiales bacterium]|nr:ABC transporter permease subunit [Acidimicrobiales bacterium]